jgi:hypothetical protein
MGSELHVFDLMVPVVVAPQGQKTAATMNPGSPMWARTISSPLRRSFRSTAKAGKALALRAGGASAAQARPPADKIENVMSLMGQSSDLGAVRSMSELPTIADIEWTSREVRDVPLEHDAEKWVPVFGKHHAPAIG